MDRGPRAARGSDHGPRRHRGREHMRQGGQRRGGRVRDARVRQPRAEVVHSLPPDQLLRQSVPERAQPHAQGRVRRASSFHRDDARCDDAGTPECVRAFVQRRRVEANRGRVHVPGQTPHAKANVPVGAVERPARTRPPRRPGRRRAARDDATNRRLLRLLRLHRANPDVVRPSHSSVLRRDGSAKVLRLGGPRPPGVYAPDEDAVGEALR